MMEKVLISACLMGQPVRYDGQAKTLTHELIDKLKQDNAVLSYCPEVSGGLATPRPPAEIQSGSGSDVLARDAVVLDNQGADVTQAFVLGAHKALALCKAHHIHYALMMEKSPSCGSQLIYDGGFNGQTIEGQGVTVALLEANGVKVFSPHTVQALYELLYPIT